MATKAQCTSCKLKFEWEQSLTIKRLHCPDCGRPVKRASEKSNNFKLYLGCFPSVGSRSCISAQICKQDFLKILKIKN